MSTTYDPYLFLHELRPDKAQARLDYFLKLHRGLSADFAARRVIGDASDDDIRNAFMSVTRANIELARAQLKYRQDPTSDPLSSSVS